MKKRILVTGGAGYIGSHTCIELIEKDYDLFIVDNFSNSTKDVIRRIEEISNAKLNYSEADIRDEGELKKIFNIFRPEAVIHFAGLKSVSESELKPKLYQNNNVFGSRVLTKVMSEFNCTKIIFSSSATVYGNPIYLPLDENHPVKPKSKYGFTKLEVEKDLSVWFNQSEEQRAVVCLRYFNPIGAHPSGLIGEVINSSSTNLVPAITKVAMGLVKELNIYGHDFNTKDGTAERDFIPIMDLAKAHAHALNFVLRRSKIYEIINIGTGRPTTVLEFLDAFSKASGVSIPVNFMPRRIGDIDRSLAEIKKSKTILNWQSNYDIYKACQDVWRWTTKKVW